MHKKQQTTWSPCWWQWHGSKDMPWERTNPWPWWWCVEEDQGCCHQDKWWCPSWRTYPPWPTVLIVGPCGEGGHVLIFAVHLALWCQPWVSTNSTSLSSWNLGDGLVHKYTISLLRWYCVKGYNESHLNDGKTTEIHFINQLKDGGGTWQVKVRVVVVGAALEIFLNKIMCPNCFFTVKVIGMECRINSHWGFLFNHFIMPFACKIYFFPRDSEFFSQKIVRVYCFFRDCSYLCL